MLHPAMAHFAISLPIISLILGLAYLYKPSELMSKISSRFTAFAAIFMILAFFSGRSDGMEIFSTLSSDAKALLLTHKDLGLYLAIAMGIIALLKFFGCYKEKKSLEITAIILLVFVSATTLYQGKLGGELVYENGAHIKGFAEGAKCLSDAAEFADDEE